jgi:flagellar basal body rod protein FlgG
MDVHSGGQLLTPNGRSIHDRGKETIKSNNDITDYNITGG